MLSVILPNVRRLQAQIVGAIIIILLLRIKALQSLFINLVLAYRGEQKEKNCE